jgi:hypothetical protein
MCNPDPATKLPPLERRCNITTAKLGYWKVGLEWHGLTTLPLGSKSVTAPIKLEDMDSLNDQFPKIP